MGDLCIAGRYRSAASRLRKKGAVQFVGTAPKGSITGGGDLEPIKEVSGLKTMVRCQIGRARYFVHARRFQDRTIGQASGGIVRAENVGLQFRKTPANSVPSFNDIRTGISRCSDDIAAEKGAIMTDIPNAKAMPGTAIHATTNGKWGWYVALGIGEIIIGGIASSNLLAANLASVFVIGAAVFVVGVLQIIHALSARGGAGVLLLLAGLVYAAAGAIILYDPVLASFTLSLAAGVFLVAAGIMRAWAGFHAPPASGRGWMVASGVLTFCLGVVVIAAWPAIGLWFLGAMLVVDLIFQGWGLIAFGMALKAGALQHADKLATE